VVGAIRDGTIELLDRTGALHRISDRAKPLPTFGAGAFGWAPKRLPFRRALGSLFPQPDRLDERLGRGWAAVSQAADATRAWRDAGVHVVERGGDEWLTRHDADWALLRPDRYVFACGRRDELTQALSALRAMIGAGLRTEQPAVREPLAISSDQKGS
jgi:hypothetical protein